MYLTDGPALKKVKQEPVPVTVEFDEFDDDFDELAMLKIDDSQFFSVNMPSTTESEVMEVDAPFENSEEDNKKVIHVNLTLSLQKLIVMHQITKQSVFKKIISTPVEIMNCFSSQEILI